MSKQEKIVCAAIQITFITDYGRKYTGEFTSAYYNDSHMAEQINDFKNNLKDVFVEVELLEDETVKGFITNKLDEAGFPRFVSPEEALEITGLGNQLRFRDRKYLLPEDLY